MFLHIPGKEEDTIIIMDTEYSEQNLIQFSSLVLERTSFNPNIYQLYSSFDLYVKPDKPVSKFTTKYTGLTNDFLEKNGLSKEEFITSLQEFISMTEGAVIVAHGIRNDLLVLEKCGISFDCQHDCTLEMAKRILDREKNLRLVDIAQEAGLILNFAHHSYSDAIATAMVYSFLKTLEMEETEWDF